MSLRIVAGKHRGRSLAAPPGEDVRPTSARAREALFNILVHGGHGRDGASPLVGARVLDVFAGTGALGLEALSRGAAHATFMESDATAVRTIGENLRKLGEAANARVVRCDATMPPAANRPCDLAFLDPPYRSGLAGKALAALARTGWLAPGALLTLELARKEDVELPAGFGLLDERRYGAAKILILAYGTAAPDSSPGGGGAPEARRGRPLNELESLGHDSTGSDDLPLRPFGPPPPLGEEVRDG